jgi:transposase-like protein
MVTKLAQRIRNEADAYAYMESIRWPNGPVCPHCGHERAYFLKPANGVSRATRTGSRSQRRVWKCAKCRRQFSVTTGTIFHGSKVSLQVWLMVFFEMCANKNGLAAREVERKYGVSPKTAWFITHRIREAMRSKASHALVGTIVADETFIGGNLQRMNRKTRERWEQPVPYKPGDSYGVHKTPVLSLVDSETGEVRSRVVADVSGATLRKVIAEQVAMERSTLHTDEGKQYTRLGWEFIAHHTVNHSEERYFDYRTGAHRTTRPRTSFPSSSGPSTAPTTT